jgi:hypothetical protein
MTCLFIFYNKATANVFGKLRKINFGSKNLFLVVYTKKHLKITLKDLNKLIYNIK